MPNHAVSGIIAGVTKCAANFRRLDRMASSTRFSGKPTRRISLCLTSATGGPGPSVFTTIQNMDTKTGCRLTPGFCSASMQVHRSGTPATIPALAIRCGRRRLGYNAYDRLWLFVVQAQPFARIAPFTGSGHDTGGLAAFSPAPTPSFTHGRSLALRSHTCAVNPPAQIDRC